MEQNNKRELRYINCIHGYLNLQENVEAKIDRYTKKLHTANKEYDKTQKKLNQFTAQGINYYALSKAFICMVISLCIAYRLGMWLFTMSYVPSAVIFLFHSGLLAATARFFWSYSQQSFVGYKNNLEYQIVQCKNRIDQSKKNIDNRIHELHEIQKGLQQLLAHSRDDI